MTSEISTKVSYLHDAYVYAINLQIDEEGYRELAISVHCNPDCGLYEWNDKRLTIRFLEPLIILGELYGHMANVEEINAFQMGAPHELVREINQGATPPTEVAKILFHSGSRLDVGCREIVIVEQ